MNEYLIVLLKKDIENTKIALYYWNEMGGEFKSNEYQKKRKKALDNKLNKTEKYLERLINGS